ncbi:MAG: hypothetical protein WBA16_04145 [Nonlabens sp.]
MNFKSSITFLVAAFLLSLGVGHFVDTPNHKLVLVTTLDSQDRGQLSDDLETALLELGATGIAIRSVEEGLVEVLYNSSLNPRQIEFRLRNRVASFWDIETRGQSTLIKVSYLNNDAPYQNGLDGLPLIETKLESYRSQAQPHYYAVLNNAIDSSCAIPIYSGRIIDQSKSTETHFCKFLPESRAGPLSSSLS